jgi:dTDP-4-amino-4,6-dideoxygalactose transaminase
MPSFTFAATAHAAIWAGLTPLLCDVDPDDWTACAAAEEEAFRRHGERIAVVVPYATFGEVIDLDRYRTYENRFGVGVVVDAAASLGTLDSAGLGFATGSRFATVFSMHATKTFATAEGGLIYSADEERMARLRSMINFGFDGAREAVRAGVNAKLPEVLGLLALAKLNEIEAVANHRAALFAEYHARLARHFAVQNVRAKRQAAQFMPMLLPQALAGARPAIMAALASKGIGSGAYFSPHLAQQRYFARTCVAMPTPVADEIGGRMLSLPLTDDMTAADVSIVCNAVQKACGRRGLHSVRATSQSACSTLLVGAGPGGAAFLTAASKAGRLAELARSGLTVVERSHVLGSGGLPGYAITSDSTAVTFLSAVKDNPEPELAALVDHPSAIEVARYVDELGVPLARTGPFLEATGDRLGAIVRNHGGEIVMGHEVVEARRTPRGQWQARIRSLDGGGERELLCSNIVMATGGYQSREHIEPEQIAGRTLGEQAGDRLMLSDEMLKLDGIDRLRKRLGGNRAPRIVIVGASASALAAAALLLKSPLPLGAGAMTLLHRRPLRPFYPSAEAALADGFTDFGADDTCSLSGFIYRLAGFRLEARELVLRCLGIGGRVPDPRLETHMLAEDEDPVAARLLAEADVVVAALGYRPRALPLLDIDRTPLALAAHAPGLYGIGLAAGFVPTGSLGGEPSFRGKANGLWLWQNDVGRLIVDQVLQRRRRAAA